MATKRSKKSVYLYILLIVLGTVFAFSSIITNDFLKLLIVMITLCVGLFGVMKGLSSSVNPPEEATEK